MKKALRYLLFFTLSLFSVISVALALHIKSVTQKKDSRNTIQLCRFDLQTNLSELEYEEARTTAKSIEGVEYAYVNANSSRLILSYDPTRKSADELHKEFAAKTPFSSELYTPSSDLATKGCPINTENKVYGFVNSIFN